MQPQPVAANSLLPNLRSQAPLWAPQPGVEEGDMSQKGRRREQPRQEPGAGPRLIYFSNLLSACEQITHLFVALQWGKIKLL